MSLHNGDKKKYIWNKREPLESLLVLPHAVIKVHRKVQLNSRKTANSPDPLKIKVWVTSSDKELRPAKVIVEDKKECRMSKRS